MFLVGDEFHAHSAEKETQITQILSARICLICAICVKWSSSKENIIGSRLLRQDHTIKCIFINTGHRANENMDSDNYREWKCGLWNPVKLKTI